jgi:MoaA/NifB/PqqE/SkfB family radical SAM enzyme
MSELSPSRRPTPITIENDGRLALPPELAARLGLQPGAQAAYLFEDGALRIMPSADHLQRVYVEPTNLCNLDCVTCMRHAWDEPPGRMSEATFARVLEGLAQFSPLPEVFFGGYGEPLAHPRMIEMVAAVRRLGARAELITNGTLLSAALAKRLVDAGLNRLWVSIDGASPQGYADVRLGDRLPEVLANLENLRAICHQREHAPRLGIAFVAMKRNIHELPEVIRLGRRLGADQFSISNLLAHTPELVSELLYGRSYFESDEPVSQWAPQLQLPRLEINDWVAPALAKTLAGRSNPVIAGQTLRLGAQTCPFFEKRSLSVRCDGSISPCLPLLHEHTSYLDRTQRLVKAHSFGRLEDHTMTEIWQSEPYRAFRARLQAFDFAPCMTCNACEFVESNQEDCFGNIAPTCGGCLWGQGFIRCP